MAERIRESQLPPRAPATGGIPPPPEVTRVGERPVAPPPRQGGAFGAGARIRVTRVRTQGSEGGASSLGPGSLIEAVGVGQPVRFQPENGSPALVTSPVRGMERIGPGVVQVVTGNSVYRLEAAPLARDPVPPAKDPGTRKAGGARTARLALLRNQARLRMHAMQERTRGGSAAAAVATPPARSPSVPDGETGFVSLADLPRSSGMLFSAGTRVRVSRRKLADPTAELEDAGIGRLLGGLAAGEPARIALDGGPSFVTSPVRRMRLVDVRSVELETENTVYRLERR